MFDQQWPFVWVDCHLVEGHGAFTLHRGRVILTIVRAARVHVLDGGERRTYERMARQTRGRRNE